MKLWTWFCHLGTESDNPSLQFFPVKQTTYTPPAAAVSKEQAACTRLCGQSDCRCGGTIRGLHCVWSHYRMQ